MTPHPRLVLLHGALGSAAQLAGLGDLLSDTYEVVVPDLPGHGHCAPARLGVDELVTGALDASGGGAHFLGYSLGGFVALQLAQRRPDVVSSVVTVATKLAWTPEIAAAEVRRLDPDAIVVKVPHFAAALDAAHPVAGWRRVVQETADLLTALGADGPVTAGLSTLRCPVRLVVGDRDPLVTVEETLSAARTIPGAQLQVLPGTAHAIDRMPFVVLADAVRATTRRTSDD